MIQGKCMRHLRWRHKDAGNNVVKVYGTYKNGANYSIKSKQSRYYIYGNN